MSELTKFATDKIFKKKIKKILFVIKVTTYINLIGHVYA